MKRNFISLDEIFWKEKLKTSFLQKSMYGRKIHIFTNSLFFLEQEKVLYIFLREKNL